MSATEQQLKDLKNFVESHKGWRLAEDASGACAEKSVEITPTSGYGLLLRPLGSGWRASYDSSWGEDPLGRPEQVDSTLAQCVGWLRQTEAMLHRVYGTQALLEDIADGRKGWQFTHRGGQMWASRAFDCGRHGEVLLSVVANHAPNAPLRAQVHIPFSAGPLSSQSGLYPELDEWLSYWERTLTIPMQLAECRTMSSARELLAPARGELASLRLVFDLDQVDTAAVCRALITMFVPAKVRAQA